MAPEAARRLHSVHDALRTWKRKLYGRRSPRAIFSEIYRSKAWGSDGTDFFSGYGSHAAHAVDGYVSAVTHFLSSHPAARVTDLGCGDFNVGKRIRPACGSYVACDVVPELIERNRRVFCGCDIDFRCIDMVSEPIPPGDIVLLRQVLQHLNNKQIAAVLQKLQGYRYLILTEHVPKGPFRPNIDKPTGAGIRVHGKPPSGVVLTKPPFCLGARSADLLCEATEGASTVQTIVFELATS
jgi:SAM-dependent methyltransferase